MTMTKKQYLNLLVNEFHSATMATIGADGHPVTRIIDLMLWDESGVYFLTAKGKSLYTQLMEQKFIALSATAEKRAPRAGGDRRGQAGQLRLRRAAGGGSRRQHPVSGQCGAPAPDDPSFHRSGAGGGGAVRRQRLQAHQPGGVPPVLAEPVSEGPLSGLEGAGGGGLSPVWQMRVGHRSPVPAAAGPPAGGCPVAAPQSE